MVNFAKWTRAPIGRLVNNMKIWKISCCANCPKLTYEYIFDSSYNYCHIKSKKINDISKLPKWCPLDDYKEVRE